MKLKLALHLAMLTAFHIILGSHTSINGRGRVALNEVLLERAGQEQGHILVANAHDGVPVRGIEKLNDTALPLID